MRFARVLAAGVLLAAGAYSHADDEPVRVPWDKLTSGQKSALIWTYGLAAHQMPTTVAHEGSHWLAAEVFGGKPKLSLVPAWVSNGGSQYLAGAYVQADDRNLNRTERAIVAIAPVFTKLVIVDRGLEALYRGGRISPGSLGDRYLLAQFQWGLLEPMTGLFAKSDIGQFAKATGLPRIPLALAIQVAYAYSYKRIVDARDGPYVPILYVHISF